MIERLPPENPNPDRQFQLFSLLFATKFSDPRLRFLLFVHRNIFQPLFRYSNPKIIIIIIIIIKQIKISQINLSKGAHREFQF